MGGRGAGIWYWCSGGQRLQFIFMCNSDGSWHFSGPSEIWLNLFSIIHRCMWPERGHNFPTLPSISHSSQLRASLCSVLLVRFFVQRAHIGKVHFLPLFPKKATQASRDCFVYGERRSHKEMLSQQSYTFYIFQIFILKTRTLGPKRLSKLTKVIRLKKVSESVLNPDPSEYLMHSISNICFFPIIMFHLNGIE